VVPFLQKNLVSASQICKSGGKVVFSADKAVVYYKDQIVLKAVLVDNGLYKLQATLDVTSDATFVGLTSLHTWHECLGHLSEKEIKKLRNMTDGLDFPKEDTLPNCKVCATGKQKRKKFGKRTATKAIAIGQIIHSDLCGPITPTLVAKSFATSCFFCH
jgi:hypothetical protein